ncbi:MAG TPA: DnaJ domain-containing protein, partial [Candidatus Polarisedimenticolia bacterium]|nr:DnaJ domain-containing protein [Candidatus Polarisedimenticolia bacterium]
RPAIVAPGRVPGNGGAPKPAPPGPAAATPTRPAATGRPGASARPAASARGTKSTAPRKVTSVSERVRPSASADLESEMLQRFDQMRDQDLFQVLGVTTSAGPDDVRRAYYGLAKRFHPDRFTREEIKAKAEKVFSHITEAYSTLSHAETRQKYDEEQALRKGPKAPEKGADTHDLARLNFRHGKDQFDKGKFGEAIPFFQNACDQDPSKSEYFHYLAVTQAKNPRWKKDAEANFLKALEIDPSNGEVYAELGALYARGGLHSKARDMFKKALEWDPNNEVAQQGLAEDAGGKKGLLGMFKK